MPPIPEPSAARNLARRYDLDTLDWDDVVARLDRGVPQAPGDGGPDRHTCWLTTVDEDGAPHVTAVGAVWHDGCFWFQCGAATRKARNLARDPRCVLAVALHDFDVVVRGEAERISDPATVATLAALWRAGGWPARVDDSGIALTAEYSAPSAGGPPWSVYRIRPIRSWAVGTTEPGGATRFDF